MNRSIAIVIFLAFCCSCSLEGKRLNRLNKSADVVLAKTSPASDTPYCQMSPEAGEFLSTKQLQTLASKVTVLVKGDNNRGSGTLLARQGSDYLVITNAHVVKGVNSLQVQTADAKTYSAQIVPETNFEKHDLALVKFQPPQKYCLPRIATGLPNLDMHVTAAGFSVEKASIVVRTGIVKQVASSPLKEGYQIGYSSDIVQGMSGGAIISTQGELLGINGRSAYPILNTGYVYQDGSRPNKKQIQQMRSVSWGIPGATFLAQVNRDILSAYSLPLPQSRPSVPQVQLTGWLRQLEQTAKKITVRIDSSSAANGSGIIIAKDGNTYTVLTAAHVVCERLDATQPCRDESYNIIAPDRKQYPLNKSTIKIEAGVDLAVVKFSSQQSYQVATLADYNPNGYMFTAGYPKLGDNSPWRFTAGQIFEKELGLLQATQSDFQSDSSGRLESASSLTGGYELVYTSITYGGMSGGPVLDSVGRVIGIHGRAEGEQALDEKTGDFGSSGGQVQLGYSLGIPVSTFLGLATQLGVQPLPVKNTPAPQLNAQQVNSIQQAVLSVDVSKGNATAAQWLERGNQLWRLRRYQEACRAFDEAIKSKPPFMHLAYYGKGLALGRQGKPQDAVAAFEQAVSEKPDYVAAWYIQSVVYRELNQLDKALVAINKAIQLQPQNPNLYNEKRAVLEGSKRYAEAETAITEAIKLSPRAVFYSNRGLLYKNQQKWSLALADYNKAIDINPQFAKAYYNRGLLYSDQKKWGLALADYNKAIDINPQLALAYNDRGNLYYHQKKWNLALADYNKAIDINPQDAGAYNNRAVLYSDQKKWDLALADYNKTIDINPQYADAYTNRGALYSDQKKWNLALADYNKAIDINPQYADAYYNRGNLYKNQKKWDLALADYNKAIDINPQHVGAYNNRGALYSDQKKWDLALADYNKAIDINPQDAGAYYNRGNLYSDQKKWNLALADYNKAIDINPQYAQAYYNRGNLYYHQKKWNLALVDYNKAIDINPQYADAYNNRGLLYYHQKKWDLALADYNKAIDINPQYAQAYLIRGAVYLQKREKQRGIQDLQQAAQLFQAQGNTAAYEAVMNSLKQLQG